MKLSTIINQRYFISILAITMLITVNSNGQSFLEQLPTSFEETNILSLQTTALAIQPSIINNYDGVENDLKVRVPRDTRLQRFGANKGNLHMSSVSFLTSETYFLPSVRDNRSVNYGTVNLGFESKMILPMPKVEDLQKFVFVRINLFKN